MTHACPLCVDQPPVRIDSGIAYYTCGAARVLPEEQRGGRIDKGQSVSAQGLMVDAESHPAPGLSVSLNETNKAQVRGNGARSVDLPTVEIQRAGSGAPQPGPGPLPRKREGNLLSLAKIAAIEAAVKAGKSNWQIIREVGVGKTTAKKYADLAEATRVKREKRIGGYHHQKTHGGQFKKGKSSSTPSLSPEKIALIRKFPARMPINEIAKRMGVGWSTVKKYRAEGLDKGKRRA